MSIEDTQLIEIQGKKLTDQEIVEEFGPFLQHPLMLLYRYLATRGTEWNYNVGVPLVLISQIPAVSPAIGFDISVGWNLFDGAYSIALGAFQLSDEDDYRQTQNKIKGVANILSGFQLLGLSTFTGFGSAAFAISMAAELLSASIDFYNAHKEHEFEGWLEERAKNIAYKQKRIDEFNSTLTNSSELEIKDKLYMEAKTRILTREIDNILNDIKVRSRVYHEKNGSAFISILESHLEVSHELKCELTGEVQDTDRKKESGNPKRTQQKL